MFGIFYLLFSGFAATVDKISRDNRDAESKTRAIQNNNISYYSTRGHRLVSNDRPVYKKTVNGQDVLMDMYTGQIYKNYTMERRDKAKEEALAQGKTVITPERTEHLSDYERNSFWFKECHIRPSYRDIYTDKLLITVPVNSVLFYMELDTGHIIRPIDNAHFENKDGNLSLDELIEAFNKRQDEYKNLPEYNHWFWRAAKFYFDHNDYTVLIDNNKNVHIVEFNSVEHRKLQNSLH